MHPQLETERLILRPFHVDDAAGMMELYADPDVQRFTTDKAFASLAEAEQFIRGYDQYERYGMGRLSTFIKATGEFIGWCGLKYLTDNDEADIGYRLIKRYRGKGYTTEAARACLQYGFENLALKRIIGMAMKENAPSINVFRKLGLIYDRDNNCGCEPGVIYVITKDEWK